MRPVFLHGRGVDLCPFEAQDEAPAAQAPWRLASPGGSGEAIALAALDAGGAFLGTVRLEALDWLRRECVLALRWAGPEAGMGEALRLAAAYAFDELNFEWLEARVPVADAGARRVVEACGFRPGERQGAVQRYALPRVTS